MFKESLYFYLDSVNSLDEIVVLGTVLITGALVKPLDVFGIHTLLSMCNTVKVLFTLSVIHY